MNSQPRPRIAPDLASDEVVIARVLAGATGDFELLMRRYNEPVYRAVRSRIRNESDAEDVMQRTYISAFRALDRFEGRARFSTWLTRIALNECYHWLRPAGPRLVAVGGPDELGESRGPSPSGLRSEGWNLAGSGPRRPSSSGLGPEGWQLAGSGLGQPARDPERDVYWGELTTLLEAAVDELPETLRTAFVLREIEEESTRDVAESLGITEEAVRVRVHRARQHLERHLREKMGTAVKEMFRFERPRCDRVVQAVLTQLADEAQR